MPVIRNTVHNPPPKKLLDLLRLPGLDAHPLVKKATDSNGKTYYPVFLPFDARVICPWCLKESAIATYPNHTVGPKICPKLPPSMHPRKSNPITLHGDEYLPTLADSDDSNDNSSSDDENTEEDDGQMTHKEIMAAFAEYLKKKDKKKRVLVINKNATSPKRKNSPNKNTKSPNKNTKNKATTTSKYAAARPRDSPLSNNESDFFMSESDNEPVLATKTGTKKTQKAKEQTKPAPKKPTVQKKPQRKVSNRGSPKTNRNKSTPQHMGRVSLPDDLLPELWVLRFVHLAAGVPLRVPLIQSSVHITAGCATKRFVVYCVRRTKVSSESSCR